MSFLLIGTDRTLEESVLQRMGRTTKEVIQKKHGDAQYLLLHLLSLCKIMRLEETRMNLFTRVCLKASQIDLKTA